MRAAQTQTRTVVVQAPPQQQQIAPRRRINTAKVKEAIDAAKAVASKARERARDARAAAEETIGEARRMDLAWAVGESLAAMTGTVGASAGVAAVDWYIAEDYDLYLDIATIVAGGTLGAASLAAGFAVHPRIGTIGLATATGVSAVGVSRLVQRGVTSALDSLTTPK